MNKRTIAEIVMIILIAIVVGFILYSDIPFEKQHPLFFGAVLIGGLIKMIVVNKIDKS
jgi:hypothetical protein